MMKADKVKQQVMNSLRDMKAREVVALDVQSMTTITDYMIVASGTSSQHIKSIADRVVRDAKKNHISALGMEGPSSAGWMLIDLNEVIVHIMLPEQRDLYQLESLWQVLPEEDEDAKREEMKESGVPLSAGRDRS